MLLEIAVKRFGFTNAIETQRPIPHWLETEQGNTQFGNY